MKIRGRDITACILAGMVVYTAAGAREAGDSPPLADAPAQQQAIAQVMATVPSGIKVETLLKTESSWDGVPYTAYPQGRPEITVVRLTIPPHTALPWHSHPMPNAAYVVSGSIVVEKQSDGSKRQLGAGQVLAEMVDAPHRGVTGDEPVVLMVFYAGATDMPLSVGH
ncbi:cupin domain-containing protein [Pusillimonas sp.]|uniref:cupin domain-containing protein n=1 Tax=Pusillimonas sp. TaxID=3040095 RepID=UPI0037C8D5A4